jgi:ABC-type Fe3+/spermidine/putrescine transport system ATPase subunit
VLDFVGFSNFLRVDSVDEAGKRCRIAGTECRLGSLAIAGKAVDARGELAIRPERIRIASGDSRADDVNRVGGQIRDMAFEGALLTYEVVLADTQRVFVREQNAGRSAARGHQVGESVMVEWRSDDSVLVRWACD